MPHQFTIYAGGRTGRPLSPNEAAEDRTEIFTLPQHVIDMLEKQCSATGDHPDRGENRQDGRKPDLTKSKKPAS
jgi:hypothetical protein